MTNPYQPPARDEAPKKGKLSDAVPVVLAVVLASFVLVLFLLSFLVTYL